VTPGVFRAGDIADRGPLERGTPALLEARARDSRELERQAEWRASANRALDQILPTLVDDDTMASDPGDGAPGVDLDEEGELIRLSLSQADVIALPTISVLGYGISRKRLEQAIKDLQLPVVVVREPDEADVVITLRNTYKQKSLVIREAESRGVPIYVLKSNTVAQMQACLTSLFVLDTDPRDAALREVEEAIGLVRREAKPVELSPQNAFTRRLQHKVAEAANLASRSRGREPYRRVRVYPEAARARR
jgi:hypothetical protein